MPQLQLPIFPEGTTLITESLGFTKEKDQITYLNGHLPVFTHTANDLQSFKMITAQFVVNEICKQMDIVRAFGVTPISVKRSVQKYREQGISGFYAKPKTRGAAVLTDTVTVEVQSLLDEGFSSKEISEKLEIKQNTLDKAIASGRLHKPLKKKRAQNQKLLLRV